jgi:hypothetical protein
MSNRPETRLETHNRYTMMELDAEAPARFPDVAVVLCVLEDPLLSPDFSLIFGHFDPPDCPVSSQ